MAEGESFKEAVRRESAEELGAIIRVGDVVFVAYQPPPGGVQRFSLSRLVSIDDAAKDGHEFHEPDRGSSETVRVAVTYDRLSYLRPREVGGLIRLYQSYFVSEAAALV